MRFGMRYEDLGADQYEQRYRERLVKQLQRRAAHFGFALQPAEVGVSWESDGILRTGCAAKYAWIQSMKQRWPITLMCEVLQVSSGGYFSWDRAGKSGHGGPTRFHSDEALLAHMRAIHAQVKGECGWLYACTRSCWSRASGSAKTG